MTVRLKADKPQTGGLLEIRRSDGTVPDGLSGRLEACFASVRDVWEAKARSLPADDINDRGHFGSCAPNVSDYGLVLAWTRLVAGLADEHEGYEVSCTDPWLYRHLALLPGVTADTPPGLVGPVIKRTIRGFVARALTAWAVFRASRVFRRQAPVTRGSWLLVYGHPASTADGIDGYFGDLMRRQSDLRRVLHVDCGPERARELMADGRTYVLHGYGSALYALSLVFRKWWLPDDVVRGSDSWLIRRALMLDSGFAGAAKIAWQIHCQRRWLAAVKPETVFWPWENHGWERSFCRDLRRSGGQSVGYQHSVVGQQWNLGPASNPDGDASLPDRIFCNGDSGKRQLLAAGHPQSRLVVAGALRFPRPDPVGWSADAPVFVAAPFDLDVARQMLDACRAVEGRQFVIRVHPMTPLKFAEEGNIAAADGPLSAMTRVSAVLYAATTVGLEAWMLGLPVLRFRPEGRIAIDILPSEAAVPAADAAGLKDSLDQLVRAGAATEIRGQDIFTPVDMAVWEGYPLSSADHPDSESSEEQTV